MASNPVPDGLNERGSRIWTAVVADVDVAGREILLEACRTADRLDELDRIIHGDGVLELLRFRTNDSGDEVTVSFDNVLAEARQQQVAFQRLVQSLKLSDQPVKEVDFLDELTSRRESKATG